MKRFYWAVCAVALALAATAAPAEDKLVQVGEPHGEWIVYSTENKTDCGIVTSKVEPESYRRNGRQVRLDSVDRGDVRLYVEVRQNSPDQHFIAFQSGYPYQLNSTVVVVITGTRNFSKEFEFMPDNSKDDNYWAWPKPGEDDAVVEAMKKGGTMRIRGVSRRPTETVDAISLIGVTKALDTAKSECDKF